MLQCPKKECGYQSHWVVAGNCSLTNVRSPSLLRDTILEQKCSDSSSMEEEQCTSHDPEMPCPSMMEGIEELYKFTPAGERELPRTIHCLIIWATITKATEIAAKAQEGKKQQTFEEMVPTWLHDYWMVFETKDLKNSHPEGSGTTKSNSPKVQNPGMTPGLSPSPQKGGKQCWIF